LPVCQGLGQTFLKLFFWTTGTRRAGAPARIVKKKLTALAKTKNQRGKLFV